MFSHRLPTALAVTAAVFMLAVTKTEHVSAGTLTLAHPYPVESPLGEWARDYGHCVEEQSGLVVEIVGEGKLGRPEELVDAVAQGLVDLVALPVWALASIWPELQPLARPGSIFSPVDLMELADSSIFIDVLNESYRAAPELMLMGVGWDFGMLVGGSELTDMTGQKLRVADVETAAIVNKLGPAAVHLPGHEVLPALGYGAIDGAVVGLDTATMGMDRGILKAIKWSSDFVPFVYAQVILANRYNLDSFSGDRTREIADDCRSAAAALVHQARELTENFIKLAEEWGANVSDFDASAREAWTGGEITLRSTFLVPAFHDRSSGHRDIVDEAIAQALGTQALAEE